MKKVCKINKITSCALALVASFWFWKLPFATEAATDDLYRVLSFSYTDAAQREIKSLEPNGELHASARVKRMADSADCAVLMTALYQNGKLIALKSERKTFQAAGASGDEQSFDVSVLMPDTVSGCEVKSYLWQDYGSMEPLAGGADFASDNPKLYRLYVGGKEVKNLSEEGTDYFVELPASAGNIPEIFAEGEDLTTKVSADYSSEEITVTASAPSGATKAYVLHVTTELPKMTNITTTFTPNGAATPTTVSLKPLDGVLHNPVFQYAEDGKTILPFGDAFKESVSFIYADRYHYAYQVPEQLLGYHVVGFHYQENPIMRALTNNKFVTSFTLNKSARVFFSSDWSVFQNAPERDLCTNTSAEYGTAWSGFKVASVAGGADFNAAANTPGGMTGTPTDYHGTYRIMDCIVPEGVESKEFTITMTCQANAAPHLFYQFLED